MKILIFILMDAIWLNFLNSQQIVDFFDYQCTFWFQMLQDNIRGIRNIEPTTERKIGDSLFAIWLNNSSS